MHRRLTTGLAACLFTAAVLSMGGCPTAQFLVGQTEEPSWQARTAEGLFSVHLWLTEPGMGLAKAVCCLAETDDPAVTVTADLSRLGGSSQQPLTLGQDGTWRWTGLLTDVVAAPAGESISFTIATQAGQTLVGETTAEVQADADAVLPAVCDLTIQFVNPPVAGHPAEVTVSCQVTDPDGQIERVRATGTDWGNGLMFVPGVGGQWNWSGTVTLHHSGYGSLLLTATDSDGLTAHQTVDYFVREAQQEHPDVLRWSYPTGGWVVSCAAIGIDGTAYITGGARLHALAGTGTVAWETSVLDAAYGAPAMAEDGTLYVGTFAGTLYAVDALGDLRWECRPDDGEYMDTSVAIGADGTIYAASTIHGDGLFAITPAGQTVWQYSPDSVSFWSPVVRADGTICAMGDDGTLYCWQADGQLLWSCLLVPNQSFAVFSSPAIDAAGVLYVASGDGTLYSVNPDGTSRWAYVTGPGIGPRATICSSPAIAIDGTVYVGLCDGRLHAVNPDGTAKWTYPTGAPVRSSPAIAEDGTVYVGSDDTYVYAVDAGGSLKWRFKTGSYVRSSPTIAPDGTVYVGSSDKRIYAFLGTSPLMSSAWPKFRRDLRNTGCMPSAPASDD